MMIPSRQAQSRQAQFIKIQPRHIQSSNQGFSLLEVLIALLILSIGLLGVASLQQNSLRNSHSAYTRTQAMILVQDMAERMSANQAGVDSNAYNNLASSTGTPNSACTTAPGCTAAAMATFDGVEWGNKLHDYLSAKGRVDVVGLEHTITIMWDDRRSGDVVTGNISDCDSGSNVTCFQLTTLP